MPQAVVARGWRERRAPLLSPATLQECGHAFASLLIDAGVNAKAIQEFIGHGTIEETSPSRRPSRATAT
jgi:site-specific recombinase XerD